ncbi:MAG: rhodanese-like domain-containing protein [Desulfohalobiaceae bacterium]
MVALRKPIWIELLALVAASLLLAWAVNTFRPGGLPWIGSPDEVAVEQAEEAKEEERFGISVHTAQQAWERDMALFVDSRSPTSFRRGHIPGAVNLPLSEVSCEGPGLLERTIPGKDTVLVVYGFEASCSTSEMLANLLRRMGYLNIVEMPDGMVGWQEAGLPLEQGP